MQLFRQRDDVLGLGAIEPDGLDVVAQALLAERDHLGGVSATANSDRVARLTPASVACADSTTATSSVKGLRCSSSPFGSGLAFANRVKASRTSAGVHGFIAFRGLGLLGSTALGFAIPGFGAFNDALSARPAAALGAFLGAALRAALGFLAIGFATLRTGTLLGALGTGDFGHVPGILRRHDRRQCLCAQGERIRAR